MKLENQAKKIFSQSSHDELWANPKGEFFSSKNHAELSLKKGEKVTSFKREQNVTENAENIANSKTNLDEQS